MRNTSHATCPDPEVVGAFVEGRLGPTERTEALEHLDHCQRCRNEVAALAGFDGIGRADPVRSQRSVWWLVAAAALVAVIGATLSWRSGMGPREAVPVAPLVAATAPLEYRLVEARLTGGFAWAEFRGPVRSSTEARNSPARLKLSGAAGEVLERASRDGSARTQHAAALASLLIEDHADAIARLRSVTAAHPSEARAWSDLAAVRDDSAFRFGNPSELPQALADVDRALRIDPQLPEALFNRALIVHRLGMLEEARLAWKRYLEVDAKSRWSREARTRLDVLPVTTDQSLFEKSGAQLEREVAAGDTAAVARFVERFPQLSRAFMEVEMLGRWAESFREKDVAAAQLHLAVARAVGAALRARSGEGLLADCVAAIDDADDVSRARLAAAHHAYRTGRLALKHSDIVAARRELRTAARLFAPVSTGGWLNARYYLVVAEYSISQIETSEQELHDLLLRTADLPNYQALRAQVAWQYALKQGAIGRWPKALEHVQLAHDLFRSLGERGNAAYMAALIGEAMTYVGRRDEAWDQWPGAFRSMSELGDTRNLSVSLSTAVQTELLAGHLDRASSLLDVELRHGARSGRMRAQMLFRRAILSTRMGDRAAASAALAEGMRVANEIPDSDIRASVVADLAVAEGIAFASTEPDRALASLSHAAEYHRRTRQILLPATLFERARLLRALGRSDEAQLDLESAIETLETQRGDGKSVDPRTVGLDGVEQIYALLAELLLERGLNREAFVVIDRAAAHGFYGANVKASLGSLSELQRQLAPGELVVEYLVLPRETLMFVVGTQRFELRRTAIAASEISQRAANLDAVLRDRVAKNVVRRASSSLHQALIAPIRDELAHAKSIIFVPDPLIASIPFVALLDSSTGRWLIEDHMISVAASALYRNRDGAAKEYAQRVAVIRPSVGQVDLPNAAAEVDTIMRLYPRATVIKGDETTATNVLSLISRAGLVHYAGHTDSDRDAGLVLRVRNDHRELLYGVDVARTRLRGAPLVILAGCRTLRGGARRDDLAASVSRAFLVAGASAVIGTSWDIDDGVASRLFTRFHHLRAGGAHPVAALRDSQLAMLHDPRLHAADWASAQIVVRSLDL